MRVLSCPPHAMSMMRVVTMMARLPPTPLTVRRGVAIGQSSGWEEDHVVVVIQRYELQAPELDHHTERKWSCHPKLVGNDGCDAQTAPTWCANCWCKKRWS
jgi:hypothetical protein